MKLKLDKTSDVGLLLSKADGSLSNYAKLLYNLKVNKNKVNDYEIKQLSDIFEALDDYSNKMIEDDFKEFVGKIIKDGVKSACNRTDFN